MTFIFLNFCSFKRLLPARDILLYIQLRVKKRFLHLKAAALLFEKILKTQNENNGAGKKAELRRFLLFGYSSVPSPPIKAVSSLMRSIGNGGEHSGFIAMLISFIGLSSAATRFEDIAPHLRQRWTIAHSPFFLTQTAMGSMIPPQSEALSPGSISTCRLERQLGQWFLWSLPAPCGTTVRPHTLQTKVSLQA